MNWRVCEEARGQATRGEGHKASEFSQRVCVALSISERNEEGRDPSGSVRARGVGRQNRRWHQLLKRHLGLFFSRNPGQ
jgi:hypothetical protein